MSAGFVPRWQPFCGAEFHGKVAGHPVVCTRDVHLVSMMHRNDETGFSWWGHATYPRTS